MASLVQRWYPAVWGLAPYILAAFDAVLCLVIIQYVSYTEIDWKAYMQEVEGVLAGNYNYTELKGDTGPLVYPAGFVYIFMGLRWLSDDGTNLLRMQYTFALFHVLTVFIVTKVVQAADRKAPLWVLALVTLSRRVHSIFVLRLFNDAVAMLLAYSAILLFTRKRWTLGCMLFSCAFSVKMNVVLFAPGLGVCLLREKGLLKTILLVLLCVAIQIVIGLPFLAEDPAAYMNRAFELGRVFTYKWTVNFRFLPEDVFVSKELASGLLGCTLISWLVFGHAKWSKRAGGLFRLAFSNILGKQEQARAVSSRDIIHSLFTSNIIGVAFARSIHYQFYCWYFHTLPFILWSSNLPVAVQLTILATIEYCYNVFPSTTTSSVLLQICHLMLLAACWMGWEPSVKKEKKIQ